MLSHGSVRTEFDFETLGKRSGFIDLTLSDNRHAFSTIRIPVGVISGGEGPTVLLSSGNHGDEYEGQVILQRLMQDLDPATVQGRIIFLPALNTPAVRARTRVSPLDGGNMNRSFPGDPETGPTGAIAAFVNAHILGMADIVLDFHSGGTATEYVDCGFCCIGPDAAMNAANLELAKVFGAPFTMISQIDGTGGDFDTAAHRKQIGFLSCELGGLGRFSPQSFQIGWDATLRVLTHLSVIETASPAPTTCFIDMSQNCYHATASYHALAQLHVIAGATVARGDLLATLYDTHNFGQIRETLYANEAGIVAICRRNPLVEPGDHLCFVAAELSPQEILSKTAL